MIEDSTATIYVYRVSAPSFNLVFGRPMFASSFRVMEISSCVQPLRFNLPYEPVFAGMGHKLRRRAADTGGAQECGECSAVCGESVNDWLKLKAKETIVD